MEHVYHTLVHSVHDDSTLVQAGTVSDLGLDFMRECLHWDPEKRLPVSELLKHPWITHHCCESAELERAAFTLSQQSIITSDSASSGTLKAYGSFSHSQQAGHARLESLK